MTPPCFSRQDASEYANIDMLTSISKSDPRTRSRSTWSHVNMTEISVVAKQMKRLEETNTLVPFSFLLLHSGKSYCQKRPNMPSKNRSWSRLWDYNIIKYQDIELKLCM